jgi:hypothetical protein
VLLGREVVVDRPHGDLDGVGDLGDGDGIEATLAEQAQRRLENRVAGALLLALSQPGHSAHRLRQTLHE